MQSILLHLLAALLYAILGLWFWRATATSGGERTTTTGMSTAERLILLLALGVHGLALHANLFPDGHMRFGFGLAISLMVWLAGCFYWIETFYTRLHGLHVFVLAAGLIASLIPALLPGQNIIVNADSPAFRAHFVLSMLAYSLFTLAALHAMLMKIAERQLHNGRLSPGIARLPPLLTMETLLFRIIGIAFVLLTLTVGSGVVFSEALFGQPFRLDHKTALTIISWLLFGILLFGRRVWGWRGRKALRWTLAGFIVLVLAYVGSRFVLEVLLARGG